MQSTILSAGRYTGIYGGIEVKAPVIFLTLFLIIILAITAFYNGLVIRNYSLSTDKFAQGESIRAVLISDLHSHIYGNNQNKLIEKISRQNPDIILLAGDIADDHMPIAGTELLLLGIKDVAPVFYVSGNHECWSGDIDSIKNIVKSYGVTVLEGGYEEVIINGVTVTIAGVDDPERVRYERYSTGKSTWEVFDELAVKDQFKILIAHRPERIEEYKRYTFDLVVSGHSHGGQVRIPLLLNGLFAPNQGLFPKYAGGMYKHDNLTHIVSRGVSFDPLLPRIFNPPEVVVIDISK